MTIFRCPMHGRIKPDPRFEGLVCSVPECSCVLEPDEHHEDRLTQIACALLHGNGGYSINKERALDVANKAKLIAARLFDDKETP